MTGPQAEEERKYNPVLEALDALDDLGRMVNNTHMDTQTHILARSAQAIGWSLLASVTSGQTIHLGSKGDESAAPPANPVEQAAKAAFR